MPTHFDDMPAFQRGEPAKSLPLCRPLRAPQGAAVWFVLVALWTAVAGACGLDNPDGGNQPRIAIEVSKYAVVLPPTSDTSLTATISGTDLNEPITWTTSAPAVASVRDNGPFGVVTGIAEGTATIYAVQKSNPKLKSPPVTVTVKRIPALKTFTIDTALLQFLVGDSHAFGLNAARSEARVTVTYAFTSSNTGVATVNLTTGVVTAVSSGNATINVTATGAGVGLTTNALSASVQVQVGAMPPRFRRITAGGWHSCAIRQNGDTFCWGWNGLGQLGDGTLTDRFTPTKVAGAQTFTEISAGFQHTCGLTAAGSVYCWGSNGHGRLGDGTTVDRRTPTLAVTTALISAIELGGAHSCALTAAGAAYCWGDNTWGQIGNGNSAEVLVPKRLTLPDVSMRTVTTGLLSTCVTSTANYGYCWGSLSPGNTFPIVVDSGAPIGQYALGQFTKCLLATSGRLYCPVGNGNQRLVSLPNAGLPFPYVLGLVFKAIVSGDAHSCGLTLQDDTYCWGSNVDGRMGNGGIGDGSTPQLVSGGLKFAELSAGEAHTCGITTSNLVYCWGNNGNGRLGSAGGNSSTPKLVSFPP